MHHCIVYLPIFSCFLYILVDSFDVGYLEVVKHMNCSQQSVVWKRRI
jgi:hypothetical protein